MRRISSRNSLQLSLTVLRHGTTSFKDVTAQETTKCLNKIGHFCLNVFATTTFLLAVVSFLTCEEGENRKKKSCDMSFLLLALCMWLQLAAARLRTAIPLAISALTDFTIFAFVIYVLCHSLFSDKVVAGIEYLFCAFWIILQVVRLMFTLVLYKVLTVKNPQFSLSTTVFLKPTNTPVTFSSVLAPQDLDPTNPYHSQTVYNINHAKRNPLNKTVA